MYGFEAIDLLLRLLCVKKMEANEMPGCPKSPNAHLRSLMHQFTLQA